MEFEKGELHKIELYPGQIILEGRYIGDLKNSGIGKHIFRYEDEIEKGYLLVDKHWVTEERGIITHKSHSPLQISAIHEKNIFMVKGLQKLIEEQK